MSHGLHTEVGVVGGSHYNNHKANKAEISKVGNDV